MSQCPHCNGRVRLVAAIVATKRRSARQVLGMTSWTGTGAANLTHVPERKPDYARTPVRAPTLQSDVAVPLAQALTSGAVVFVGTGGLAYALDAPKPLVWAGIFGFVALGVGWRGALQWTRQLVHKVEQWTNTDIDGDGVAGEPQADIISPIPVHTPQTRRASPAPLIRLRPSERTIELDKLCDYLTWAVLNGWTRDQAQAFGLGQKEWPDVRDFVDKWGLWGTSDRPALEAYVASLCQR